MSWPSQNVAQGGILHPAKTNYRPETKQLMKLLLDESRMSIMQRRKFEYFLRNGEPFPTPRRSTSRRPDDEPLLIRPGSSKRRTLEDIVRAGLYEREPFRPQPTVDREEEKRRLQHRMAFGKVKVPPTPKPRHRNDDVDVEEFNRFDQLAEEIKERQAWLKEMEELGEADKYRTLIQQQIQQRVREMEQLKVGDKSNRSVSG